MLPQGTPGGGPGEQVRGHRGEGELPGPSGVDPAQQGFQQPVRDLRAEPVIDVAADGHIVIELGGWSVPLRRGGRVPAIAQQPAELFDVGGHPLYRRR
jgi:hypothetical protein